jgi:hypothetical protein
MSLGVAARVKAHISTAYIDADGRGVRALDGTGVSDRPDCMLSPAEFHARTRADAAPAAASIGPSSRGARQTTVEALREAETHAATVSEQLERRRNDTAEQERLWLQKDWQAVAAALFAVRQRRQERRDADRQELRAKLDRAYAKRGESGAAMAQFLALSRDTTATELRDREETAMADYVALHDRRERIMVESAKRAEEQATREEREHTVVTAVREARATAQREAAALEAKRLFEKELAKVAEVRRRNQELQRQRDAIQLREDVERGVWRGKADRLVEAETHLAQVATSKEQALHMLVNAHRENQIGARYGELKKLQLEFERHAAEIAILLQRETKGTGVALELVMAAAKDTAKKKRTIFHGLELLATATYVPSGITPTTAPAMDSNDGRYRSLGVQFPEAAPTRRGPQQPTV